MENQSMINSKLFITKDDNLTFVSNILNIDSFVNKQISSKEVVDRMESVFTNDKCNRFILSNFENQYITISGKFERFGFNRYFNNMSVQDCYIEINGEAYFLSHMWWQNVQNKSILVKGDYIRGTGIVKPYKCSDIEFPCDQSYGISDTIIW